MMRCLPALWLSLAVAAHAGPLANPPAPQVQFVQHLDAQLPLHNFFTEDSGKQVRLDSYFGKLPVVLVLGYYHCPNLCSTLLDGVFESLVNVGLPSGAYRVLGVSIDPSETAALAAHKKTSYAALIERAGGDLHLLTGQERPVRALADSVGFQYAYDASNQQFVHPAGFLIITPQGRISHYFMGVRFDARDVRLALVEASAGHIGSPTDRLLLLCSHYDPQSGHYNTAAMMLVRMAGALTLAVLGGWMWRHRTKWERKS